MIGHPPPDPADWYERDASFNRTGKLNGKGPCRVHRSRPNDYIAICGFILLIEESGSDDHEGRPCKRCLRMGATGATKTGTKTGKQTGRKPGKQTGRRAPRQFVTTTLTKRIRPNKTGTFRSKQTGTE